MNENNNNKYEVIAKYIKDVSFEIPTPEAFVDAAKNLGTYITKIDFKSNPYKGNLVELNCKLIIEAPENIKNKMRSEIVMSIVFKIIDAKLTPEEIKKIVLVTIPSENFDFIKSVVTDLFQKSGFKNFNFNKEINFEALYNQQKTN